MRHILFEIPTPWFAIPVMGYGLMIVLGFISGISLAHWRARRCGEDPEHVMNLGLLALIGGVVGARLLYVFEHSGEFGPLFAGQGLFGGLFAIINVRAGGLDFYGGVLLAVALAVWYIVRKKLSTRRMLDIVAPSLMLGLAFGRAGCFLNGCCWGGRCMFGTDQAPIAAGEILSKEEVARRQAGLTAEKFLTVKFPFASPAYDQQAGELPWEVVNRDGQTVGWIERHEFEDGQVLHVARENTAPQKPNEPEKPERPWPAVRVPVELLRPVALSPLEVARQSWKVVDSATEQVHYYLAVESSASPPRYGHEPVDYRPLDPVLELPPGSVVFDPSERPAGRWTVNFSYLTRDDVRSSATTDAQRHAAGRVQSLPIYPAQLYGIVNALLLCLVLTVFFRRRRREGQVFTLMLILYPISRFLLEGVRRDTPPKWFDMTFSQALSLPCFAAAVLLWLWISSLPPVAAVPSSDIEPLQPGQGGGGNSPQ